MRGFMRVVCVTAVALTVPRLAVAQLCHGNPALSPASAGNLGMGAWFFDGGRTYGAAGTFGGPFFVSGSFAYTDFDDTTLSLKQLAAGVGYEVVPQDANMSVCPSVGAAYGFGLEILGVDVTTLVVSPAVTVGFGVEVSPTVVLAPFAQVALNWARLSLDAGPLGDESETDASGTLVLGFGLIFNDRVSVGPAVVIPVSEDDGDTSFGLGLSFAVGGRR